MTSESIDAREQTTVAALSVVQEFAAGVAREGLAGSTREIVDKALSSARSVVLTDVERQALASALFAVVDAAESVKDATLEVFAARRKALLARTRVVCGGAFSAVFACVALFLHEGEVAALAFLCGVWILIPEARAYIESLRSR